MNELVLRDTAGRPADGAAAVLKQARVRLTYLWRHGRLPDLRAPQLFTELVQVRKLFERDIRLPALADKARVKAFVAGRIGTDWIIPTLWQGSTLPHAPQWTAPFVVKARHGTNQTLFVHDDAPDWPALRRRAGRWMKRHYGGWLDEWLYEQIPRDIIVEPFMGLGRTLPIDYKFYVFGGRVEFVQVHLGRGIDHRWLVFDRAWGRVSSPSADADPVPPASLETMIAAAEALADGIDFVRVDLYEIERRPLFGEMTFYPGSGLDRFDPVSLDATMGALWLAAIARQRLP